MVTMLQNKYVTYVFKMRAKKIRVIKCITSTNPYHKEHEPFELLPQATLHKYVVFDYLERLYITNLRIVYKP